jgi:hypothetical protein
VSLAVDSLGVEIETGVAVPRGEGAACSGMTDGVAPPADFTGTTAEPRCGDAQFYRGTIVSAGRPSLGDVIVTPAYRSSMARRIGTTIGRCSLPTGSSLQEPPSSAGYRGRPPIIVNLSSCWVVGVDQRDALAVNPILGWGHTLCA